MIMCLFLYQHEYHIFTLILVLHKFPFRSFFVSMPSTGVGDSVAR